MISSRVYLDTESTGLSPADDALLEIAITDDSGTPLLNTLICPPATFTAWPAAQAVHGITAAMVRGAPTLAALAPASSGPGGGCRLLCLARRKTPCAGRCAGLPGRLAVPE